MQILDLSPFPSPIMTSSLSTYAKATFLENAFPRKKSRRSRKPIFTVWFFYTLEVWRNFAQGFPFFPQRTIVWNHFWKSILISVITFIHDITYENGGSNHESQVKNTSNVSFKKTKTIRSSNKLLRFVLVFLKQMLSHW